MWKIIKSGLVLLVAVLLISALAALWHCYRQDKPQYHIRATLSISDRDRYKGENNDWKNWRDRFRKELDRMKVHVWSPQIESFKSTCCDVGGQYDVDPEDQASTMAILEDYLNGKVHPYDISGMVNVESKIIKMIELIDHEHPNILLKDGDSRLEALEPDRGSGWLPTNKCDLPRVLSSEYPVGVSLTPSWKTANTPESKTDRSTISIVANSVTVQADKPPSSNDEPQNSNDKPKTSTMAGKTVKSRKDKASDDSTVKVSKEGAKTSEPGKKESASERFSSEQEVTLSLSTVLNSPCVHDRIEYVSTYIYLNPFPFPPNGGVVMEKEFWRRFFSLNAPRHKFIRNEARLNDMDRVIEDMRVRVVDTPTTVIRELDFGTLKQTIANKLDAEIAGKILAAMEMNPKLTYSYQVSAEENQKLQQQLDQHSVYVDPRGNFLRITQRGMQSVNLAGRINEKVKLRIPVAEDDIAVLAPADEKASEYEVRRLSQPLYSRVDALTMSVVVARQPTALTPSTMESYRLEDPKDAVFIVGVTRPYCTTVWENERILFRVTTTDIFGDDDVAKNKTVFFTTFEKERPVPLRLYKFTPEQVDVLLSKIRKQAIAKEYGVVSLALDKSKSIKIGFRDKDEGPSKLVGFKMR
jgi:hypothetical protein